jgi:hypothetical protein
MKLYIKTISSDSFSFKDIDPGVGKKAWKAIQPAPKGFTPC